VTGLDLDAIKAREDRASEGPWSVDMIERHGFFITGLDYTDLGEYPVADVREHSDADFIANARTDVPALVAEVERQAAAIDAVLELHQPVTHDHTNGWTGSAWTECQKCRSTHAGYPCATVLALNPESSDSHEGESK